MSPNELAVLAVFQMYQVCAGRMLCFTGDNLTRFAQPLADLTRRGFVTAERFSGGYSLTDAGFSAVKMLQAAGADTPARELEPSCAVAAPRRAGRSRAATR